MTQETQITDIVNDYYATGAFDYIGLWQIPIRVRHEFNVRDDGEIRRITLLIVKRMIEVGFHPLNLEADGGVEPWKGESLDNILERISSEWERLGRDPNPGEIAWFDK